MRRILAFGLAGLLIAANVQSSLGQNSSQTKRASANSADPLDNPPATTWRTHRDAGHLDLLNPNEWQFHGCQTFSAIQLRKALAGEDDVIRATYPAAPAADLDKLPALLADLVLAGYQNEGFPHAKVHAALQTADANPRIVIVIDEGPRYIAGDVEIYGTAQLDAERLLARLTEPYIPEEASAKSFEQRDGKVEIAWYRGTSQLWTPNDPVWQAGKPARLAEASKAFFRKQVQQACAAQGYPDAQFEIELTLQEQRKTAALTVRFSDEGPPLVIRRVFVFGNRKNPESAMIDYLAVKPGTLWTREERLRVEQRLWESARFRSYKLAVKPASLTHRMTLYVSVKETKAAPPLGQPFSPEEQAMLNLRRWLAALPTSDDELSMTWIEDQQQIEAILSPRYGGVAIIRAGADRQQAAVAPARTMFVSTNSLGLFSASTNRKLLAASLPSSLTMELTFDYENADEARFRCVLGIGFQRSVTTARCTIKAAPALFVSMAHGSQTKCTLADGVLTFNNDEDGIVSRIRVDAASGRPLDAVLSGEDTQLKLSLVSGRCRQRIAEVETELADQPNAYNPQQPLGSILRFVAIETLAPDLAFLDSPDARAMMDLLIKAAEHRLLEPLDEYLVRLCTAIDDSDFAIPKSGKRQRRADFELANLTALTGDDLAGRNTWPWDLGRELMLLGICGTDYTSMELAQQLKSATNGPLAHLTTAAALTFFRLPKQSQRFAARGLETLNPARLHADVVALADDRGLLGRCLLQTAEVFRALDESSIDTLSEQLPKEYAALVLSCWQQLQEDPERPIAAALVDALDHSWPALEPQIDLALHMLKSGARSRPTVKTVELNPVVEPPRRRGLFRR